MVTKLPAAPAPAPVAPSPSPTASRSVNETFSQLANRASNLAGSFWAFAAAVSVIVVWALLGPLCGFSETWQLVINTGTTIVTFLMVFLIQHAQNKDMRALQLKLNELIAAQGGASNRLIDVESDTEEHLQRMYEEFKAMARRAAKLPAGTRITVDTDEENQRA